MKKRTVLFIVNPASAGGRTLKRWNEVIPNLEVADFNYDVQFTKKRGCGVSIAAESAISNIYDTIISVGGDGTANEIVNGLMLSGISNEQLPAFTIFPSGTGSDSVRTLGIPKDIEDFVRMIEENAPKLVDVGVAEFVTADTTDLRYFLNACDVGIGAVVANEVNSINEDNEKKSGKGKYFRSIIKQIFRFKAFDATYVHDGHNSYVKKTVIMAVCNGMFFGGGVKISPISRMDDGVLELVATDNVSKLDLLDLVSKIYTGSHVGHPKVRFQQAVKFEIKLNKPHLLETDGEVVGVVSEVNFKTLPQALKVLH